MTDTITTTPTRVDRPVSVRRRGTFPGRLLRWIAYDARLVSLGVQTMADAVTGENRTEASRLEQLTRFEWRQPVASGQSAERERAGEVAGRERVMSRRSAEPGGGELFGFGLVTSVLGVVSWFLGVLLVHGGCAGGVLRVCGGWTVWGGDLGWADEGGGLGGARGDLGSDHRGVGVRVSGDRVAAWGVGAAAVRDGWRVGASGNYLGVCRRTVADLVVDPATVTPRGLGSRT